MEFSGLSVIEVRNLVSSAVGYAYLGNGFLCTLCVLKNSGPHHGRKRNKKSRSLRFWSPNGKHWKPWKTSGSPKSTAVSLLTKIWLLTHWPIKIGRKSKNAQQWMESLYAPLWPGVPVCLSCWQNIECLPGKLTNFAPLHTLKSVVVSPKTDCQSKKKWFSYGA